ncbi:MAG: GH1 family beta-glucosidase [Anaerolineae bacterium]|jgi:beta-glucosidase|nr:GH1 family beta-glucosidase [Anaerolineae bacterium]
MDFPKDFIWGTATSSYQIEGETPEAGRGDCIWGHFARTPGKVVNGETGAVACDHYYRYKEDVALLKSLGVNAYRFSVSWPRVLPLGLGATNAAGLDFYSRLVDELLANGITPYLTLYHWDLPWSLQELGGWTNKDMPAWFAEYTGLMTRTLGDRVKHWITINEPWCVAHLGHLWGVHAPGLRDPKLAYMAAHQTHLAHGAAMRVIRETVPGAQAGITLNLTPAYPASDDPQDVLAAQYDDGFSNRWFLDPVFKGKYPADMVELLGEVLDGIDLDEVSAAAAPQDFLGVNFYSRGVKKWNPDAPFRNEGVKQEGAPHTAMGWEVYPQALEELMLRLHREYVGDLPILITENGAAYIDPEPSNGVVEDPQRAEYYRLHLDALSRAIAQGAPVKGYFAWSLMDNYEWAEGYAKRFGIVHVDFETQQRTLKRSALQYRDLIAQGKA